MKQLAYIAVYQTWLCLQAKIAVSGSRYGSDRRYHQYNTRNIQRTEQIGAITITRMQFDSYI